MFLFTSCSEEGSAFLEKRASEAVRIGDAFAFEPREGRDLVARLIEAGLRVKRDRTE
jgi:hypothetical protein